MKNQMIAFITGASSGIGAASAHALAAQKYSLILCARREDRLSKLAQEIRDKYAVQVHICCVDINDTQAVDLWLEKNPSLLPQVEILLNNAGLAKGLAKFQDSSWEDTDLMLQTNVRSLLYITRKILPFMTAKKSGHIINIGSVSGRWVYPSGAVYCATKFAVRAITEGLRMDLAGTAIRVTNIEPGMVNTDFSLVRLEDSEKAKLVYKGMTPLQAADIAETVAWIVSRPKHVNIQELVIYPTDQAAIQMVNRV